MSEEQKSLFVPHPSSSIEPRTLEEKLATLPNAPGVYLDKNAEGKVIYIGKARPLRSQVLSYFTKDNGHSPFTCKMVRLITDFEE